MHLDLACCTQRISLTYWLRWQIGLSGGPEPGHCTYGGRVRGSRRRASPGGGAGVRQPGVADLTAAFAIAAAGP